MAGSNGLLDVKQKLCNSWYHNKKSLNVKHHNEEIFKVLLLVKNVVHHYTKQYEANCIEASNRYVYIPYYHELLVGWELFAVRLSFTA